MKITKDKIFISHSSQDLKIVESFVELILRLGLNIPSDRIFCTSMEGHGVLSGEYIPDRLRKEIQISSIAFLFISRNYKSSEICLNEVGAAWATLEKTNIIILLLPGIDFKELGILDFGRFGLRINDKSDLLKLIEDNKDQLNPRFELTQLNKQIESFLEKLEPLIETSVPNKTLPAQNEVNEWQECFENNLSSFDDIIRQILPTYHNGVFEIKDIKVQNTILKKLSQAKFLDKLWYKHAEGDYYVKKLKKLATGNWLITEFNWEIKISSMWVSKDTIENQYEFILIYSDVQEPYEIASDVGGKDYNVGILRDGTIVSEIERSNGYAVINGETIDLFEHEVEIQYRDSEPHWVFFVTDFHKAGFNADETIDFCKKLDSGEIEVNERNILQFLRGLRNHPTVVKYR